MGPYIYKTVHVNTGTFGSPQRAAEQLQRVIDQHVADGWELFTYHPVQTAVVWQWNMLIFRKPSNK